MAALVTRWGPCSDRERQLTEPATLADTTAQWRARGGGGPVSGATHEVVDRAGAEEPHHRPPAARECPMTFIL